MTATSPPPATLSGPPQHPASVFWRFWAATTTSGVGSMITTVALPLTAVSVLDATPLEVGVLTAAGYLGWLLLTLPAGAIATHLPLRGLQASVDLLRGAAILAPALVYLLGELALWHLVLAALVVNLGDVFAFVANTTYIPTVVPRSQLAARNSLMSATDAATQLGGPSLAGAVVAVLGAPVAFLLDAVSYLVSGVLMWTLPRATRPAVARQPMTRQIREGWAYVLGHPLMRPMMLDATATNFVCGGLLTLTPLYLVRELGAGPATYGLLVATEGVGALVGAALTTRAQRRFGSPSVLIGAAVGSVGALAIVPWGSGATGMGLFALGNGAFAALTVMLSVITRTYRQQESPPELLARVMATVRFVSWSAIPVGGLLAGWLAGLVGVRGALLATATAALLSPAVLWASPLRSGEEIVDGVAPRAQ